MLKANELRIGNYIQCLGNALCVEYVDKLIVKGEYHRNPEWDTSVQIKHCRPIIINEGWLFDFGFTKDLTNDIFLNIKSNSFLIWQNNRIELLDDENNKCISFCNYVHQLQNLHFALTGEELILHVGIQGKTDK